MSDERRCEWCRHFRTLQAWSGSGPRPHEYAGHSHMTYYCALNRPLQPCADYEREPGADDERGEHE